MPSYLEIAWGLAIIIAAHKLVALTLSYLRYRRIAKNIGFPLVFSPFTELNFTWGAFQRSPLYPLLTKRLLPVFGLHKWAKYTYPEWRFTSKYEFYEELDDIWTAVSPDGLSLQVADPDVAYDILRRANDFTKVDIVSQVMDFYGRNIMVVEGAEWKHHRKIAAPGFSEQNNQLVWAETIRQCTQLTENWSPPKAITTTQGLKDAALNIISYAGFGVQNPMYKLQNQPTGEAKVNQPLNTGFSAILSLVTKDFRTTIGAITMPAWLVNITPALRETRIAYNAFRDFLLDLINKGQEDLDNQKKQAESGKDNLLNRLLRSEREARMGQGKGLTESELLGNTFIMVIAGHETTAATLDYVVAFLALHEDKQEWMLNGLDQVLKDQPKDPHDWPFELHKKLTTVICVMHEALRCCPPVPSTLRDGKNTTQVIQYKGKDYEIPPYAVVNLNFVGIHYNPKVWGEDCNEFKPERWDIRGKGEAHTNNHNEREVTLMKTRYPGVLSPRKGAYMPFGEGNRACLGRRFAEVEMIAAIAVLFQNHRAKIALKPGESKEDGRRRMQRSIDSSWSAMVTCIREPTEVVFTRRK